MPIDSFIFMYQIFGDCFPGEISFVFRKNSNNIDFDNRTITNTFENQRRLKRFGNGDIFPFFLIEQNFSQIHQYIIKFLVFHCSVCNTLMLNLIKLFNTYVSTLRESCILSNNSKSFIRFPT